MNIPSLDILPKLFTFLGLALIFYTVTSGFETQNQLQAQYEKLTALHIQDKNTVNQKNELLKVYDELNKSYIDESKKLITKCETQEITIGVFRQAEKINADIYEPAIRNYQVKIEALDAEIRTVQKNVETENDIYNIKTGVSDSTYTMLIMYTIIGFVMFLYGVYKWERKEKSDRYEALKANIDKPTFSDNCQSCGKHFNAVVERAKDGDKTNYHFCNSCYADGSYIEPELTLQEMINKTKQYLEKYKTSKLEIRRVVVSLHKLDRWKRNQY